MTRTLQASPEVIAQYSRWQSPRRGTSNPEKQTNALWRWLVDTRAWPHAAHAAAGSGDRRYPGWCFDRFGQSETELPDGTRVHIGGEHEDHYDPDFYIYNDVVTVRPDGTVDIFGYPTDVFPPTDFHSAVLSGDEIIVVGGLRYPECRVPDDTQVYGLRLSDFSIHRITTTGDAPPWLHDHDADLDETGRKIICSGGRVIHGPTKRIVENLTTWELDLETLSWTALETRDCQRWLLMREDEGLNELWHVEEVAQAERSQRWSKWAKLDKSRFAERGHVIDADLFEARFTPPIPHRRLEPDPDAYRVHRIEVDGVTVRFVEDMEEIAVTVEGKLGDDLLTALERYGIETYSALEGVPYKSIRL